MGRALLDYHRGQRSARFIVHSDLWEDEVTPVADFYRPDQVSLPDIERLALRLCRGRVLDLGAGAGRHALELQRLGLTVTAVDILPEAVTIMRDRGVADARLGNLDAVAGERFDTVLLLMHGLGLVGTLAGLARFFERIQEVVNQRGRIICDSADLRAVSTNPATEDRSRDRISRGEVRFRLTYRALEGAPYPWLFVGPDVLAREANRHGFRMKVVARGDRGAYLARIEARV